MIENKIKNENLLLIFGDYRPNNSYQYDVLKNFNGISIPNAELEDSGYKETVKNFKVIYVCGDLLKIILNFQQLVSNLRDEKKVYYIDDLIYNVWEKGGLEPKNYSFSVISSGQVPLNFYNLGIYFGNLFGHKTKQITCNNTNHENRSLHECNDIFEKISNQHTFQTLTESNKPNNAFRTGLYITNVEKDYLNQYFFKLLRCSTNFSGPTEKFSSTDIDILDRVNEKITESFEQPVELNHVLAQIYHNQNNKKASIKSHSDKTKDMPKNGLIAFCSFYKFEKSHVHMYKDISTLSSLHFKLKKDVQDKYVQDFSVTLHPNSVFLIPLSTNRLYTHEIRPSSAPIQYLPIRMGYVIRCSNQNAIYSDGQTFVLNQSPLEKIHQLLQKPTALQFEQIKNLYLIENTTSSYPDYSEIKHLSLNNGDFEKPITF